MIRHDILEPEEPDVYDECCHNCYWFYSDNSSGYCCQNCGSKLYGNSETGWCDCWKRRKHSKSSGLYDWYHKTYDHDYKDSDDFDSSVIESFTGMNIEIGSLCLASLDGKDEPYDDVCLF